MTATILRPSAVPTSAVSGFCQADACETIDTRCAEPVRLHRPVRLAQDRLPGATSFWRWLLGETTAASPLAQAAARRRQPAR